MNAGANPNLLKPGGTFGDYTVVKLLGAGGMGAGGGPAEGLDAASVSTRWRR